MKKKILGTIGLSSALLLTACADLGIQGSDTVMEFGDTKLTVQEYYESMRDMPFADNLTYGEVILEEKIINEIFVKEYGDKISDEDVEKELADAKKDIGTEKEFEEFLELQDITEEEYKEHLYTRLLVLEAYKEHIEFSDDEIKEHYDDSIPTGRKVRHILTREKDEIEEVIAKLADGAIFVDLVKEYSVDDGSVNNGGEYELIKGEFIPEFEEAAMELEKDEISDIVESDYGYHIIELVEEGEVKEFEDAKEDILNELYVEAIETRPGIYEEILHELLNKYEKDIDIHEETIEGLVKKLQKMTEPIEINDDDMDESIEIVVPDDEVDEGGEVITETEEEPSE